MEQPSGVDLEELLAEFAGASLGDARSDDRLRRIVARIATDPIRSFPEQMATVADREALYRFLRNPKVTWTDVLSGHVHQTAHATGDERLDLDGERQAGLAIPLTDDRRQHRVDV